MFTPTPKLVIDENNNPVAVLLDYQDWQKIEQVLGLEKSTTEEIERENTSQQSDNPESEIEVNFTLQLGNIPETHKIEAKNKAKEAYVMVLLRYGEIGTGRAAELLDIHRVELFDRMGEYGISVFPDYTDEELEREVNETAQMLEQYKQ